MKTHPSTQVEHHQHLKKRLNKRFKLNFIDRIVIFSGPLIPIAAATQAYAIWVKGETAGVSMLTWSLLTFTAFTMALYAIHHKEKPLLVIYIPLFIVNLTIVLGLTIL